MDTPGGVVTLLRVGVWQALRRAAGCGGVITPCVCVGALMRARAGRDGGSEDGCMCAAGRAGVPPRHKKRAACAALENYG